MKRNFEIRDSPIVPNIRVIRIMYRLTVKSYVFWLIPVTWIIPVTAVELVLVQISERDFCQIENSSKFDKRVTLWRFNLISAYLARYFSLLLAFLIILADVSYEQFFEEFHKKINKKDYCIVKINLTKSVSVWLLDGVVFVEYILVQWSFSITRSL